MLSQTNHKTQRKTAIVDFHAPHKFCRYVTTLILLVYVPSIRIDKVRNHVLMLDLTSRQDATENLPLSWSSYKTTDTEAKPNSSSRTLVDSLYWESECFWLQLENLALLEENLKLITVLSGKHSIVSLYSNTGTSVHSFQIMFQLFRSKLFHS